MGAVPGLHEYCTRLRLYWSDVPPAGFDPRTGHRSGVHHQHLHSNDRGCTRPGCDVPGYKCEVHHIQEWATTHCTDVNTLTLACGADHPLVKPGGWTTRKRKDGTTEWIPHPTSPRAGGTPRTTANREPTPSTTPKNS
jgi:hypothetical protein